MNKVFLIGNLTRDPELTETSNGTAVCRFPIAVNRNYTDSDGERRTDYFNCTAWRGLGESVSKYCAKGNKVAVSGSIQIRNYEDNQGNKRTAVDVIAQDVEFLSPKKQDDDWSGYNEACRRRQKYDGKTKPAIESFDDDGDIPF